MKNNKNNNYSKLKVLTKSKNNCGYDFCKNLIM